MLAALLIALAAAAVLVRLVRIVVTDDRGGRPGPASHGADAWSLPPRARLGH
jgi:hypothetical protein